MLVRGFVHTIKDGLPVANGTEVRIYSHDTNSLLATTTTLSGEYEHNFQGNPGPYKVEVTHAGETHISSSKVVGMSGPTNIGGIPLLFRLWHDGYIPDLLDELEVTSTGVGMQVQVGGGAAICRGVLYDQSSTLPLNIDAADGQQRIDVVALQVVPAGADDDKEGRALLVVKKGTPAASPTPASLTQTSSLWEMPLAHVTVDIGASSIAGNKVADVRSRSNVKIGDGYITTAMIGDGQITNAKLATDSVDTANIVDNAVTPQKLSESYAPLADNLRVGTVNSSPDGFSTVYKTVSKANTLYFRGGLMDASANSIYPVIEIAPGGVTNSRLGTGAVTGAKVADGHITESKLGYRAVTNDKLGQASVTFDKIALGAVTNNRIDNEAVSESKLSSAVTNKLNNTSGGQHDTAAPFDWVNVNSTSWSTLQTRSVTLGPGRWALFSTFEGMVKSQTSGGTGLQVGYTGSGIAGLVSSHAIQNVEGEGSVGNNFSFNRTSFITVSSSGARVVNVQVRKLSGSNGAIMGTFHLNAIRVGH